MRKKIISSFAGIRTRVFFFFESQRLKHSTEISLSGLKIRLIGRLRANYSAVATRRHQLCLIISYIMYILSERPIP